MTKAEARGERAAQGGAGKAPASEEVLGLRLSWRAAFGSRKEPVESLDCSSLLPANREESQKESLKKQERKRILAAASSERINRGDPTS